MTLSREVTCAIVWVLDNLLPPVVRDSSLLCRFMMFIGGGGRDAAEAYVAFKERAHIMDGAEYTEYYRKTNPTCTREVDLNKACVDYILDTLVSEPHGRGGAVSLI
ncbi:hypothetical protein RsTz2092_07490 [Deferribacterales bacterium RsTz2092]|nr:hypothetical protein AGMMS49941_09560 [Deferribacterales bacterium]